MSSYGQKLTVQEEKLEAYGCDRVYREKASAASMRGRPELEKALDYVREGDTFVVTRLDRLARSVADLSQIARTLERKGVGFVVLDQAIDTTTPTGRLMFHVLGAIAEFERELTQERAQEGREKAKDRGVRFGAKPKLTDKQLAEMRQAFAEPGVNRAELAALYGISRASLYRLVADNQKEGQI